MMTAAVVVGAVTPSTVTESPNHVLLMVVASVVEIAVSEGGISE